MAQSVFTHAKIKGVVTVLPEDKIALDSEKMFYENDSAKLERLKKTVGLNERCVVKPGTTPGDLCFQAAQNLIEGMKLDISDLDALICVLDFPDYKIPPTSCVLHGRLNLPQTCMAFDVSHGCAGYVYGLFVASSLIESRACRKVLLLVGDTKSQTINIKDRVSAPLFGDGAAATLIEYSENEVPSSFVIGTDGSLFENIMIPAFCGNKGRKNRRIRQHTQSGKLYHEW